MRKAAAFAAAVAKAEPQARLDQIIELEASSSVHRLITEYSRAVHLRLQSGPSSAVNSTVKLHWASQKCASVQTTSTRRRSTQMEGSDPGEEPLVRHPQPVHAHDESFEDSEADDVQEATELRGIALPAEFRRLSRQTTAEDNEVNSIRRCRLQREERHWHAPFSTFWKRQINISVPHVDCRDHLGKQSELS